MYICLKGRVAIAADGHDEARRRKHGLYVAHGFARLAARRTQSLELGAPDAVRYARVMPIVKIDAHRHRRAPRIPVRVLVEHRSVPGPVALGGGGREFRSFLADPLHACDSEEQGR